MYFNVINLGLANYNDALAEQMRCVQEVQQDPQKRFLIICSHPPVVTLGRASEPEDLQGWNGETLEVSRGGRATYHGPSQLVVYPILSLEQSLWRFPNLAPRDLHSYLQFLEQRTVEFLKPFQVQAQGGFSLDKKDDDGIRTGVWVGDKKIASIGIAVKRWVSYHGIAINITKDPLAFQGMSPCGFTASTMISLEEVTGQSYQDFLKPESPVLKNLLRVFYCET